MLAEKAWNASIRCFTDLTFAAQNNIRLSVNIKWTKSCFLQPGWCLKDELVLAIFSALERYSIVKTKRRGDKGPPCLSPLPPWKCPTAHLFRLIVKLIIAKQVIIHSMKMGGTINFPSVPLRNSSEQSQMLSLGLFSWGIKVRDVLYHSLVLILGRVGHYIRVHNLGQMPPDFG